MYSVPMSVPIYAVNGFLSYKSENMRHCGFLGKVKEAIVESLRACVRGREALAPPAWMGRYRQTHLDQTERNAFAPIVDLMRMVYQRICTRVVCILYKNGHIQSCS